jgi:hypothetical protein
MDDYRGPRRTAPQPDGQPEAAEERRQARPVFTDELTALLEVCKGGGFQNRRDYTVISLFAARPGRGSGSALPVFDQFVIGW